MTLEECVAYLERAAPALDIPAEHVAALASATRRRARTRGAGDFTARFHRDGRQLLWQVTFDPADGGASVDSQACVR